MTTRPQTSSGRHGQIQFGETIMVVIVIVFLLFIGMVFYFNATRHSVQATANQVGDVASLQLAKNILSLPEVGCNPLEATGMCIDGLKLAALAEEIHCGSGGPTSEYYCQLFGYAHVSLTYVTGTPQTLILYESAPPNVTAADTQFLFTTLYNPVSREQRFAYINVTRYTAGVSFS